MEENQVAWIKIKKISKKENLIAIFKLFVMPVLFTGLVYVGFIFAIQLIPIIWKSDLLQNAAQWLRYIIK